MFSVKNTKLQVYQKLRPPHPNKITIFIITYIMFYVTNVLMWCALLMYNCKVSICQMY